MKKRAQQIIQNPLFSGSAIMLIGSNFTNVISYIYHLVFGRLLGPENYSELISVISVYGLITASFGFLGTVVVKFISSTKESEQKKLFGFFEKSSNKLAVSISIFVLILSFFLSDFLHIDRKISFLLVPLVYFSVKNLLYKSVLNGLLRFKELVISSNFDMSLRLIAGTIFVFMGFSVMGVFFGFIVSSFLGIILLKYYLRDLNFSDSDYKIKDGSKILSFVPSVFVSSVAVTSFFSMDVILAKHYLAPFDVGIYGALSNMGKIIFYTLAPISAVMFPLVSKRHSQGQKTINIFLLSILLTLLGSSFALIFYKFFPDFTINLLFGSLYLEGSKYLFYFGLIMSIFSLNSLIFNYYLAKEKTLPVVFFAVASITQIVGILIFHNNVFDIIKSSLVSVLLLSALLVIYTVYETKKTQASRAIYSDSSV